jgi:predicted transcriptional regulator
MPNQKPSKLELYIEILSSLEKLHSSNLITIQEQTNIEQAFLKRAMTFLENQNLVRKENIDNQVIYMTTERGDRVSRYFMGQPEVIEANSDSMTNFA